MHSQLRPRLPIPGMPRYFPPPQPFFPRDMSAAYFLPPRFAPSFPPYRQKLPVYNSKPRLFEITSDKPSTVTSGKPSGSEEKTPEKDEDKIDNDSERKESDTNDKNK